MSNRFSPEELVYSGKYGEAARLLWLKVSFASTPSLKDLNLLGFCEVKLGHYDKARETFLKAVALFPRNPAPLNNLGNVSFMTGDYSGARDYYLRALNESVWAREPRHNLVLAYLQLGLAEKALSTYDEMMTMMKMCRWLHIALALGVLMALYLFFKR